MVAGDTVSHDRILDTLGAGGMGVVYKAEDLRLSRLVALTFLAPGRTDRLAVNRFIREARTASALNHPNICTIYEIDQHAGQHFIAMELLEGRTLDQLIAATRTRPRRDGDARRHFPDQHCGHGDAIAACRPLSGLGASARRSHPEAPRV
jgi:serine/threonine protein kinase